MQEVKNLEASHILLVNQKNQHLLNSLGKKLTSGKVNYREGYFYSFSFYKNKEGKSNPWKIRFQNFFGQLLTPAKAQNCAALFFVVEKSTLLEYLQNVGSVDQSIAWKANLNGFLIKQIRLPFQDHYKYKKANAPLIKELILSRFYWFIKRPIEQMKQNGTEWKKGNSHLYRLLFALMCCKLFIAMPLLSLDYNMTWDEPEDRNYFTKVLSYYETFGKDDRCITLEPGNKDYNLHEHLIYYGPLVNLTTAFVNKYISPLPIYETRHIIISLFALIGLIYTSLIVRKMLHWRAAFLALIFMALTPTIFGHSMNNQKDIPFMSFYIMSVFYILQMIRQIPKIKSETIFMMGLSGGLLMSVRIAGLLAFAYLSLFMAMHFLQAIRQKRIQVQLKSLAAYAFPLIISFVMAYVITISLWPAAHAQPLTHPFEALRNFEKFGLVHIYEIFEGNRFYMKDLPWYYLPKSMLISIPLFVLLGFAIFLIFTPRWIKSDRILMILFVFIFPLLYIIYKDATVYSTWRHVLFVYPPFLVLSVYGWEMMLMHKNKIFQLVALLVIVTLGLKTEFWMIKNHPYQYLYYNELVGGVKGAYGKYELDYWTQSPKEAIEWILEQEKGDTFPIQIASNNDWHTLDYVANHKQENGKELLLLLEEAQKLAEEIRQAKHQTLKGELSQSELEQVISPLQQEKKEIGQKIKNIKKVKIRWAREQEWNEKYWDYAIWTTRTLSAKQMTNGAFPPKGTIKTIDVDGKPIAAIVKRKNQDLHNANKFQKKGKLDSAISLYQKHINYDPLEEEAYRGIGLCYLQQGKMKKSKFYLNEAIQIRPENYYAWNLLGILFRKQNQIDSAMVAFQKAVQYKTNFSSGYAGLGEIYLEKKQLKNALIQFEKAIEFGGLNISYARNIAQTYFQMGNDQEAAKYSSYILQNDRKNRFANYLMAQIFMRNGRKKEAAQYIQRLREAK